MLYWICGVGYPGGRGSNEVAGAGTGGIPNGTFQIRLIFITLRSSANTLPQASERLQRSGRSSLAFALWRIWGLECNVVEWKTRHRHTSLSSVAAKPAQGRFGRIKLDMWSWVFWRSRKQRSGGSGHRRDTKRNISTSIDIYISRCEAAWTLYRSLLRDGLPALWRLLCTKCHRNCCGYTALSKIVSLRTFLRYAVLPLLLSFERAFLPVSGAMGRY